MKIIFLLTLVILGSASGLLANSPIDTKVIEFTSVGAYLRNRIPTLIFILTLFAISIWALIKKHTG